MKENRVEKNEAEFYRGEGVLFGDPEITPKRSYNCRNHGMISSPEIEWQGIKAHCPHCGEKLTVIDASPA